VGKWLAPAFPERAFPQGPNPQRAFSVIKEGKFKKEIIPIEVKISRKETKCSDSQHG
jgi:hypothetical protein